ncbi:unnamed protein product [Albugo candida]|uniref:Uncharacterized protein n=1 Tax=Albugo candida TaxID=65357 RepID=A0A024G4Q2_9STRA|nr:unnamed protein product [Albugo candida]|eukprot:CCI41824.1 unnamed protein product [Albugo candida]
MNQYPYSLKYLFYSFTRWAINSVIQKVSEIVKSLRVELSVICTGLFNTKLSGNKESRWHNLDHEGDVALGTQSSVESIPYCIADLQMGEFDTVRMQKMHARKLICERARDSLPTCAIRFGRRISSMFQDDYLQAKLFYTTQMRVEEDLDQSYLRVIQMIAIFTKLAIILILRFNVSGNTRTMQCVRFATIPLVHGSVHKCSNEILVDLVRAKPCLKKFGMITLQLEMIHYSCLKRATCFVFFLEHMRAPRQGLACAIGATISLLDVSSSTANKCFPRCIT